MNPTGPAARRHSTAFLVIILISYFMILLDNSIIFTALPAIERAMHVPAGYQAMDDRESLKVLVQP